MSNHGSVRSSSTSDEDEEGWLDVDVENELSLAIVSLVDERVFPDAAAMLAYCKDECQLDFLAIRDRLHLDFYGCVRLVNFIRNRVQAGLPVPGNVSAPDFESEDYLRPVLADDALLQCLDDLPPHAGAAEAEAEASDQVPVAALGAAELLARNAQLQDDLEQLSKKFESYRLVVQQTLDRRWEENSAEPVPAGSPVGAPDGYFQSYGHNDIHETMLKDTVRTDAYRDFIYQNKHLFAGKTVLDVGCGTGILSMFCARAGAKLVVAVDNAAIIDKARENIFHNGLDGVITCLRGQMEEVKLPVESVDIIVSEWMGYCLLYEAMLPSVLWARDRYLAPDGLMVPSHAALWLAPVSDPDYVADHVTFWRDVYGFDMKAMQDGIYSDVRVEVVPASSLCGRPSLFRLFDLHSVTKEDLVGTFTWESALSPGVESLEGFLAWFDVYFADRRSEQLVPPNASAQEWVARGTDRVAFTTGPHGRETHWRQGLLLCQPPLTAERWGDTALLSGEISLSVPADDPRALALRVEWTEPSGTKRTQAWAVQ